MLVFSFCLSRPVTMSFRFPLTLFSCCLFSHKKRIKKTGPPLETHNAKATQRASPPKRTQFDCQAVQAHTPQSNFLCCLARPATVITTTSLPRGVLARC